MGNGQILQTEGKLRKVSNNKQESQVTSSVRTPALGRGRPTAATVAAITDAIMASAADIFLEKGFEATTMEAVADRAGVTKVTLYKRFSDKRSLLRAVLLKRRPQWTVEFEDTEDGEERLKQIATAILVQSTTDDVRACHALAVSAWSAPSDMPAREEVFDYASVLADLENEIAKAGRQLQIEPKNAAAVAAALMAMLSGWYDHRVPTSEDAADAAVFAQKAVTLLIHGKAAW